MYSSSSSLSGLDVSAYFKDIIASRQDRQDDRLEDADLSKLSEKDKKRLADQDKATDELIAKALADKSVTREEYDKIMKALDAQNTLLDRLVPDKTKKDYLKAMGNATPMQNQDMALAMIQKNLDKAEKAIEDGVKSGKIDAQEKKILDASLAKTRELLDKALEDGTISKGEFSKISTSESQLLRSANTYSRNRRYARSSLSDSGLALDTTA
ncbi:hypothetical protein NNJEOMEG_01328 [Fundidesulfovibrio magnetotacticus]|uniref:Uncharacterized protein n=1 Tax=Fundidesulfovibrio magnetotacticus TaxID=2730080 RepID=A0A6V8LZ38_9BACT|nr:hypothetical protein [Fundidesulfovibrio magnetotacticus]GFK93495.1 hypothetical protein NNJEOMEG_01328 [Fundidesulfovibrio magnetotacticus]